MENVTRNDKDILELVHENREYFGLIYEKYFTKVYKYIYFKVGGKKEIAEDIVSQTFLNALGNIHKVKPQESYSYSILPWLYTIARNLLINSYRSKKTVVQLNDASTSSAQEEGAADWDDKIDKSIRFGKLQVIMQELDEETSEIIYMKVVEEMTFEDIADQKGLNLSSIKMKYYRAIKYVAKSYSELLNNV